MKHRRGTVAITAFLLALAGSSTAAAAGLGNVTFTQQELNTPIANFGPAEFKTGPGGSNTALVLRDVMIVMGSYDSGKPPGALHMFDIKDPRAPKLLKTVSNTPETNKLRELHAMPVAIIDGKDYLVMPTTTGIVFFDFTDPLNPRAVGSLDLAGVNAGDYDNAAWEISWSWPYAYVGGTGNGVYIVDARDPTKPTLARRITTGELGNYRIGPVHAAGNYIVVSGMDQGPTKVSVLDVSNPASPRLLATGAAQQEMYSAVVIGDRLYGAGANGQYSFVKWSPTAITTIATKKFGSDKGGYCTYQDGFIFCGQSTEGYRKIDVRNEANIVQVLQADIPNDNNADTDFATVMGNMVFLGNDHGTGSAIFPHQTAPDTTPPKLVKGYPEDQSVRQPVSSRITLFFSDEIDTASLTTANITLRKVGGTAVEGVFSHSSFNAVSFGPKQPLEADSTYEVVVAVGAVKDLVGNANTEPVLLRFSTGATVTGGPGGTGGAGGTSSGGSGGSGGAIAGGSGGTGGATIAGASGAVGVAGSTSPGASGNGGSAPAAGASAGGSTSAAGSATSAGAPSAGSPAQPSAGSGPVGTAGSGAGAPSSAGSGAVIDPPSDPDDASGCSCSVPGTSGSNPTGMLALLAASLGLAIRKLRRGGTKAE